jgi:hypothetical protein
VVVNELALTGNAASTQTADAADISGGDTAGQLLAGNLEVYVDDANGLFTADELARIQDVVKAVDAVVEPFGVSVVETNDPSLANVVIDTGSTTAAGGYADGILGCYSTDGDITLIQGWNWYAGSDPTQIGSNQYDFQTTVTHELGHALGLGESADPTSAMYGTLAPGTAIRTLTTADLNIPYDEGAADPQRAGLATSEARTVAELAKSSGSGAIRPELLASSATDGPVLGVEPAAGVPGGRQAERSAADPLQLVLAGNAVPAVTAAPAAGAGATSQAIPTGLVSWALGTPPAPVTAAGRGGSVGDGEVQPMAAPLAGDLSSPACREPAAGKEKFACDQQQPGEQTSVRERRSDIAVAVPDGSERVGGTLSHETGEVQGEVQGSKDLTMLSPLLALLGVCWGAQGAEPESRKHPRRRPS